MRWSLLFQFVVIGSTASSVRTLTMPDVAPHDRRNRHTSRRRFLSVGVALPTMVPSVAAPASPDDTTTRRPFAPLPALLPVTRLRVTVDRAYDLSVALSSTDQSARYDTLVALQRVVGADPNLLFRKDERRSSSSSSPLAQLATGVSSGARQQYRRDTALTAGDKLSQLLNQADVERQWGMLRYQESKREESNVIRAAFNYYTSRLVFGDSYLLTANAQDKKRMIRDERLPTLTNVVTSDLDLRDLYRNQFLTVWDDAVAEVAYQVKNGDKGAVDVTDAVELLSQAHGTLTKWFALIAPEDVREAKDTVLRESET